MFEDGNEEKLASFQQRAYLYVICQSEEEILDVISKLEKLTFIDCVTHNFIFFAE